MSSLSTLESLGFSKRRSNHYASWVPIYLEPMVGSGERICIGVAAADQQQTLVCAVPGLDRLDCLYGRETDAFLLASKLVLEALTQRVTRNGLNSLADWSGPVEGLVIGPQQVGAGEDIRDVAHTGLMQCASLVMQVAEEDAVEPAARMEGATSRLEDLVKESVIAIRPELSGRFGVSFQASENARPTRIGYAGKTLVANFGLLAPGKLAPLVSSAKAKLWDLKQLKSGALSGFLPHDNIFEYELLLHCTRQDDPQYSDRQITKLNAAVLGLEEEADKMEIRCRPLYSSEEIASFVLQKEAA